MIDLFAELNSMEARERQTIAEIERMSKEIQMLEAKEKPIRREISNIQSLFGNVDALQNQLDASRTQITQATDEKTLIKKKLQETKSG